MQEHEKVAIEFAKFTLKACPLSDFDCMCSRESMDRHNWWVDYDTFIATLQKIVFKLFMQPASSSCCEGNRSTYLFVQLEETKCSPNVPKTCLYS